MIDTDRSWTVYIPIQIDVIDPWGHRNIIVQKRLRAIRGEYQVEGS